MGSCLAYRRILSEPYSDGAECVDKRNYLLQQRRAPRRHSTALSRTTLPLSLVGPKA